ncbi:hypothetical protein M3Y95_00361600 [Aphelenchoides besseyi]|nr:hypothetical protein M3Y95_00361600 [Aphelenchoides besseyi]
MHVLILLSCLFHEDLEQECEYVTYDFNPILEDVYASLAEVENYVKYMNLESFANEAHENVATEIRRAVQSFCTVMDYGDQWFEQQYGQSKFGEVFPKFVAPIFEKYHFNSSDTQTNFALGRLRDVYIYVNVYLHMIRHQFGIIGFDEETFAMEHPELSVVNSTYSDLACHDQQIRAKACIFTVPNEKIFLLYTRQDSKRVRNEGVSYWSDDAFQYVSSHSHKTLLENAIDKKPKYMVKSNDTLMFVSDVNCTTTGGDDLYGFKDRKSERKYSYADFTGITLCSRKYIAATTEFNPKKHCKITDQDNWHENYFDYHLRVELNCTLSDGNTTFEERGEIDPGTVQRRLFAKTAIEELGQMRTKDITKWEHNQNFGNNFTKTVSKYAAKRQTECPLEVGSGIGGFWLAMILIVLFISLAANVALVFKYSKNECVERYGTCFKNKAVNLVRIRAMNFENENFENPEDQPEEQSKQQQDP